MDVDTSSEQNAENNNSGMLFIVLFNRDNSIIEWDIIHYTGYNWKPYDIPFY